jgi:hypothetical protein
VQSKAKARSCTKFYSWCQLTHVTGALASSTTNMISISRSVREKQAEDGEYMSRVKPRREIIKPILLAQICNDSCQRGKAFLHHARKVSFHTFITWVPHKGKGSYSSRGKL